MTAPESTDVPEGELCQGCFQPFEDGAGGYAVQLHVVGEAATCWVYWHEDCYWEHAEEGRAIELVESQLDGDYDPW